MDSKVRRFHFIEILIKLIEILIKLIEILIKLITVNSSLSLRHSQV